MGFFRKPEIGTGALPSSVVSEFESNLIGVVEPLVGGGGFSESCLLSCRLDQFDPIKWKIKKPGRRET